MKCELNEKTWELEFEDKFLKITPKAIRVQVALYRAMIQKRMEACFSPSEFVAIIPWVKKKLKQIQLMVKVCVRIEGGEEWDCIVRAYWPKNDVKPAREHVFPFDFTAYDYKLGDYPFPSPP